MIVTVRYLQILLVAIVMVCTVPSVSLAAKGDTIHIINKTKSEIGVYFVAKWGSSSWLDASCCRVVHLEYAQPGENVHYDMGSWIPSDNTEVRIVDPHNRGPDGQEHVLVPASGVWTSTNYGEA